MLWLLLDYNLYMVLCLEEKVRSLEYGWEEVPAQPTIISIQKKKLVNIEHKRGMAKRDGVEREEPEKIYLMVE